MQSKKRQLSQSEGALAEVLLRGKSLAQVAKFFGTNKPAILKAIGQFRPVKINKTAEEMVFGGRP